MRAPSPIFAIDVPPVRRVKLPLPKRKRNSAGTPPTIPPQQLLLSDSDLSAPVPLQPYYTPIPNVDEHDLQHSSMLDFRTGRGADEEIGGDGDYIDHLQQPGNTKKRKVPANMSGSRQPSGLVSPDIDIDSRHGDRGASLRPDDVADTFSPSTIPASTPTVPVQLKGRMSAATLAGLQHKEMLKNRKRQLAAVLGALSHGDTLALDQALSARYPFGLTGDLNNGGEPARIRLSVRRAPRLARAARARRANKPDAQSGFPSRKFTLVYPSTSRFFLNRLLELQKSLTSGSLSPSLCAACCY